MSTYDGASMLVRQPCRVRSSAPSTSPDAKRRYVRRLFATIADRYDFITRFLSFGRDRHWKARLVDLGGRRPRVARARSGVRHRRPRVRGREPRRAGRRPRHHAADDRAGAREDGARRRHGVAGRRHDGAAGVGGASFDRRHDRLRPAQRARSAAARSAEIHRVLRPGGRAVLARLRSAGDRRGSARVYLTYLTIVGSALGLGAAPRSGHVSLHSRVDSPLSRRARRRRC